jgi:hypothetical protein
MQQHHLSSRSPTRDGGGRSTMTCICRNGLNVHNGQITCRAVADALKLPYTPADQALHVSTNDN